MNKNNSIINRNNSIIKSNSFINKSNPIISQTNRINKTSSYLNKFRSVNDNTKMMYVVLSIIVLILIIIVIYLGVCYYNYSNTLCHTKKDFWDYIVDFNSSEICVHKIAPEPPKPFVPLLPIIENKNEVFHIANQDYTYDQAKCKCESYGARLATKNEITDSYNNGANWCTYGWSDKQSAYYPVQQCEWDKIEDLNERLPKNKQSHCGVPGINGGFFANPELKFGVNCYGIKPKGSIVKAKKPYCPPMNFCKLESNFQASNKLDTDEIVGFNNEQWNMNV